MNMMNTTMMLAAENLAVAGGGRIFRMPADSGIGSGSPSQPQISSAFLFLVVHRNGDCAESFGI
jgi:hypothetical protein